MDDATYTQRVLARASHRWYNEKLDIEDFFLLMDEFIEVGNRLDKAKKALMYGRDFDDFPVDEATPMIPERDQRICHAILGVATEGVELVEAMSAYFQRGERFDTVNLQEECGDLAWYRAFLLNELGQTHVENIIQNDAKLEKRFGSTFSEDAANNRDLDAERNTLEGI
jgi:NTP pyrophosphatase (non-canonical NTP hydrolase)